MFFIDSYEQVMQSYQCIELVMFRMYDSYISDKQLPLYIEHVIFRMYDSHTSDKQQEHQSSFVDFNNVYFRGYVLLNVSCCSYMMSGRLLTSVIS